MVANMILYKKVQEIDENNKCLMEGANFAAMIQLKYPKNILLIYFWLV
jgi:hypothetical protein